MCVSPVEGRVLVASGSEDWTVRVWDLTPGGGVGEPLVGHSDGVTSVAMCVSPADGRVLVPSGRDNSTVRVGHDLTSDKSLVWSTRSLHQSLDCRGALLSGIVGLTEGQVRLLEQRGATGVRLLNA
jgi:WD40 repeat protein